MKVSNVGIILIFIAAACLGYISNEFTTIPGLAFSNELDPLDALSILLSFIIVIYLSVIFERFKEGNRLKKDIVIKKCEDFFNYLDRIHSEISQSSVEINKITNGTKRIYESFESLCMLIKSAGFYCEAFNADFMREHRELRILATYTSAAPSTTDPEIRVQNGAFIYSTSRINEITSTFDRLGAIIMSEQLRIAVI